MNKKTLFTSLALATVLGASMTLPTTASAHEVVRETTVKVIRDVDHHDRYRRHDNVDRWYVERHREAKSRWAPHDYHDKHHKKHWKKHWKKHSKKHRHDHDRYERRVKREYREYRPVEQQRVYRRHDNDSLRISIGYDIVM